MSDDEIDDSATSEDEIDGSASASSSSSSSSPAPARGQLWRHRFDSTYAVVTNLYGGLVNGVIITTGREFTNDEDTYERYESPLLLNFVGDNEYVGNFDGSKWIDNRKIVTVRLNVNNNITIADDFGPLSFDTDLKLFLQRATFQSVGPASAGSAQPRLSAPDPIGVAGGSDEESAGAGGEATSSSSTSRGTKRRRSSERKPRVGDRWTRDDFTVILLEQRGEGFTVLENKFYGEAFVTKAVLLEKFSYKDSAFAVGAEWEVDSFTWDGMKDYVSEPQFIKSEKLQRGKKVNTWSVRMEERGAVILDNNFFLENTYKGKGKRKIKGKRKMPKAVYKAARSGDIGAIEKMINEENLDINEEFAEGDFDEGQFILVEAIYDLRVELVEFLLKNGANTEIVSNYQENPYRPLELVVLLATRTRPDPKRQKIIDLLLEYGADTRRAIKIAERHERSLNESEKPYPLLLQLLRYGRRDGVSECPICFEALGGYGIRDSFIKLSCGHMFHRACIEQVSVRSYGRTFPCPMCRVNIRKSELEGNGARYVAASLKRDGTIVYKLGQYLKF